MNEISAKGLINQFYPNIQITDIEKIGEGLGNVAFEVNHEYIFRFPKSSESQVQLAHEIAIQPLLSKHIELPVPSFTYIAPDKSFVGYIKLKGIPLINKLDEFNNWANFIGQVGKFISDLHNIPSQEYEQLHLLHEDKPYDTWKQNGHNYYLKTKTFIPEEYTRSIDIFFNSETPKSKADAVLCHNDLGIEHILVTGDQVTGIIDFGGNAITDRACEFARIYRDLGNETLMKILDVYDYSGINKQVIHDRAVFYGKCLLFEDLFYSVDHEAYRAKCLKALSWMF